MHPQLVVMETCSITGWVHDLCVKQGYEVLVADPSQEARADLLKKGKKARQIVSKLSQSLGDRSKSVLPKQIERNGSHNGKISWGIAVT